MNDKQRRRIDEIITSLFWLKFRVGTLQDQERRMIANVDATNLYHAGGHALGIETSADPLRDAEEALELARVNLVQARDGQ
jgi:hypothetical protein